ncbi:hypothetical protein BDA96_01G377100 [Sorghum bicolor]|uniref:Uncharacterized protein n=1 Tax=Sorghum bicolor TaxID=4558 RepID=A0A921S3U9_SORBI|nr:hypothetical protein BDA96_01G377100 [Sorghum bicolor]
MLRAATTQLLQSYASRKKNHTPRIPRGNEANNLSTQVSSLIINVTFTFFSLS